MSITQVISTIPQPPTMADSENFDERAEIFLNALPALTTELNAFGTQANSTATGVNDTVTTITAQATAAASSATSAASAKTSAEAARDAAVTAKTSAETAATTATTKASEASTSAGTASTKAGEAAASATAAAASAASAASIALGNIPAATTDIAGKVELTTTAEVQAGTDTTRAVTSAGAAATYSPLGHNHDAAYAAAGHNHNAAYAAIAHDHAGVYATASHDHASTYAPIANGVTNGDSHDHSGGDGAQISYTALADLPTIPTAASQVGALASGADINLADYKVQRPYLQDWSEVVNARGSISGAVTIDLELGNVVTATITGATQFTFSNPPASGRAGGFVLVLTNGGAGVVTWPTSCKGLPTTLTASGKDLLAFLVVDGGTTYDCSYKLDVK